jgi:hypothetical protein
VRSAATLQVLHAVISDCFYHLMVGSSKRVCWSPCARSGAPFQDKSWLARPRQTIGRSEANCLVKLLPWVIYHTTHVRSFGTTRPPTCLSKQRSNFASSDHAKERYGRTRDEVKMRIVRYWLLPAARMVLHSSSECQY